MDKVSNFNKKIVAIMGILLCCIYFFTVIMFVATGSVIWGQIFDIVTMISGVYFIFLIIVLPFSKDDNNKKLIAIVFVAALMIFTNTAHTINLVSIQNIKYGKNIPDYLKLGKVLSYITAIENLGWGIFLGLAFLFSSLGVENKQELKSLKITLFICSCLCIIGFFGWLIYENLWYIASIGYGIGTLIISIELLLYEKNKNGI
jgi:hypothetical protein